MASYYGTLQWYQSRRSSAAHRKIENENETEIEGSNFRKSTGSTKAEDEGGVCWSKNFQESIEGNMNEIRRMIADMTSKQSNHSDFSSRSVSNQRSTSDWESQHLFNTKSMRNYQVSLQSDSSKLYEKHKLYSAVELDDRRDRGLCLWCDEFWYIGHDCCTNKKFYVFDIDVDDALEVNENDPIESRVDVNFVEEHVSHCETKLIEDCVENESNVWSKITCEDGNENWESSEAVGKNYIIKNNELQVFDKMYEKNTPENIAEKCVVYTICSENEKLGTLEVALEYMTVLLTSKEPWLYDEGSGNLMDTVVADQLLKRIGALCSRLSMLEGFNQSWIAWPELPVPPPEPPPTLIWA